MFLVNRSQVAPLPVEIVWQRVAPVRMETPVQVAGTNQKAANAFACPDAVTPRTLPGVPVENEVATLAPPPLSFAVLIGG